MPFKSEAQRRYMWMHHPKIAKKWAHKYGSGKNLPMHKTDKGFYSHMTHASLQHCEESVEIIGDGYGDSFMPKTPKTAKI